MAPTLPSNAPFTPEQQAWVNGFLAGLLSECTGLGLSTEAAAKRPSAATVRKQTLLILFGSQTGSAEAVAKKLAKEATSRDYATTLHSLNDHALAGLSSASHAIIVTSTWGDGDPPENAALFWSYLSAEAAPRFEALSFAVLGLGDKNYADFCGAAKKIHARFETLGAKPITPLGECDVDYKLTAEAWTSQLWRALGSGSEIANNRSSHALSTTLPAREEPALSSGTRSFLPEFNRANPFPGRLKTNRALNQSGSSKDTRHFEILVDPQAITYQAGDALGVLPRNCPALVEELLATLKFGGDEAVQDHEGKATDLQGALVFRCNLANPSATFLKETASRTHDESLQQLLRSTNPQSLNTWLWGRDILDILRTTGRPPCSAEEFVSWLQPLRPRLYSISSSPKVFREEIHLTVAVVRYESMGRQKRGVCSSFLAERVLLEGVIPLFVQSSHGFKPPADPGAPMIMVGPGTGIAPFMAFLQERRATAAQGSNWLFFGDQHRASDFLYESELLAWRQDGFLNKLDLAFSRDQEEKLYVQNRMSEHGAEVWKWLENGAHFYVCGDAKRMAKDVDTALHALIRMEGGLSLEKAADYVDRLKESKRYQRDVY